MGNGDSSSQTIPTQMGTSTNGLLLKGEHIMSPITPKIRAAFCLRTPVSNSLQHMSQYQAQPPARSIKTRLQS